MEVPLSSSNAFKKHWGAVIPPNNNVKAAPHFLEWD
jgi:hypothetical protein